MLIKKITPIHSRLFLTITSINIWMLLVVLPSKISMQLAGRMPLLSVCLFGDLLSFQER